MPDRYSECGEDQDCDWDVSFETAWVQYLDVGQGDGTFLFFPAGGNDDAATVLIDLGSKKNAQVAGSCARQFIYCTLKKIQADNGWLVPRLSVLVVTHGDGDHYNLIIPLLEMFKEDGEPLDIGELVIGGRASDFANDFRKQVIQPMAAVKRLTVLPDSAHDPDDTPTWTYEDGTALLYILSANYPEGVRGPKNPKSVVLKLDYAVAGGEYQVRAIFMGDAEAPVEGAIIGWYTPEFLASEALKLGHHGSQAGSSAGWITVVHPEAVFASADMKWAHPYCSVIERVKANTRLWDNQADHSYLCGRGAGVGKEYEQHDDTPIGVFVNLTRLETYGMELSDDEEEEKEPDGRRTATIGEMETVYGSRFEMAIAPDGEVIISEGALAPGARLREVFRRPAPVPRTSPSAPAG